MKIHAPLPHDSRFTITLVNGVFQLSVGGTVVASGPDPRKLSNHAFDNHALSVRHDYDLRRAP